MNKSLFLTLAPALFISMLATTTQARDIHKAHPIYKTNDLFCVKFEHKSDPVCVESKGLLLQESSYDEYRDVMRMKRQLQNNDFNRSIFDALEDNKISVIEYEFLKSEAFHISPSLASTKTTSK